MTKNENNRSVQLELTLEEANTVIEALGHMPFMRVYRIIEKIHLQASNQASPKAKRNSKS